MISKLQQKAKKLADTHGYKLRKIKDGKVKVTCPDGEVIVLNDYASVQSFIVSRVYEDRSNKNIFE